MRTYDSAKTVFGRPVHESRIITVYIPSTIKNTAGAVILRSLAGAIVAEQQLSTSGNSEIQLSAKGLASGLYFIELTDVNSFAAIWRGKVVLE